MGTSSTAQPTGRSTAAGPSSTSTNSTGSTTTPAAPTGPPLNPPQPSDVVGRSLDEALTTLWGRGLNPDSFVNLGPPPDPSQAEIVTGITVLPDGRIQVRFYNSAPRDAAEVATPRDAAEVATPRVRGGANPRNSASDSDTTSTPAGPTGFQVGDLATLLEGADRAQERILAGRRAIGGVLDHASGSTSVSISSLSIPEAAAGLRTQQQIFLGTDLHSGPGVTHTIRAQTATPNEGILDYDSRFTGNSGLDVSTYNHYIEYRGFLIFYNSHDRLTPDLGRPWPTFLDRARQLIDRRFPPQVRSTTGATP